MTKYLICIYWEHLHIHTKYEVTTGRIANQRKVPEWLPFKNYTSE